MLSNKLGQILIVDDEGELKNALVETINAQGYTAVGCTSGHDALTLLEEHNFDVLLSDLMMPAMDGITLLERALEIDPHLICIVMTGQGTIQTAVEAMKIGAFDYVLKPFKLQALLPVLARAISVRRLRQENLHLRETLAIYELCQTIAFTLDPQTVLSKLADAALQQSQTDEVSILLPTGDGKELYVAAVRGKNRERLLGERVPLEKSISSWVARKREPLLLDGQVNDARFTALWPRRDILSAISVPLQVAGKLVGVININTLSGPRPFTLGQMKALTILAGTAAAALESASLYGQAQRGEEKYRSIFDNAIVGMSQSTSEGRFITVNQTLARILGYESPAEVIASITDISSQLFVDPQCWAESVRLQAERGIVNDFEFEAYRKGGEKIWLSLNRRSVRDTNGAELYTEGATIDITERKRAEAMQGRRAAQVALRGEINASLAESKITLRRTLQLCAEAMVPHLGVAFARIWTFNKQEDVLELQASAGLHTNINGSYARVPIGAYEVGRVAQERQPYITNDVQRDPHVSDEEWVKQEGMSAFAGYPLIVEDRLVGVMAIFACQELPEDTLEALASVADIISQGIERKRAEEALRESEEQLRQSQKLEAVGRLAGGIAHDFNNLLTAINGYSELSIRKLKADDPVRCNLEEVMKAGNRAAGLTRQLLAFSRKQVLQPRVINLNDVISDTTKMLRHLIGEDIELIAINKQKLGYVRADPGQLNQVLMNLAVNARDAMPQGGKLIMEADNVMMDEQIARNHASGQSGPHVRLTVTDSGCGMDKDTQQHIFEPFFTTKEIGHGTGLGLSTVYGIVKQSNGHISVYSEVGTGTTFKIYLPRVDAPVDEKETAGASVPGGTEAILLVEDEQLVRQLARDVLEMAGYTVLEAANGDEGLKLCKDHKGSIELMLTDVVMPRMSGRQLAEQIIISRPQIRILYMSGYTDDAIVHHGVIEEGTAFLEKPFTPEMLARKVREVLDQPRHSKTEPAQLLAL